MNKNLIYDFLIAQGGFSDIIKDSIESRIEGDDILVTLRWEGSYAIYDRAIPIMDLLNFIYNKIK